MFQENELKEFQGRLRKFADSLASRRLQVKRATEDPEGRREYNRKKKARGVAKQREENPEKLKKQIKKENDARGGNGEKKFEKEQKYGHIFPCACCHTWKSRDQVVELNPQQMDKIERKAQEYHQTLQVNTSNI